VAGTGNPNGATIGVQIQLNGGGAGNAGTQVVNEQWSTIVMMQSNPGQTGTATATAGSGGVTAQDTKNFTL
jgi:hypothetical protein